MKKRILSLILAVMMIVCVIPAISLVSFAADSVDVTAFPDDTNKEHFVALTEAYSDTFGKYAAKVKAKLDSYGENTAKIADFYLNFTDVKTSGDKDRFVRILDYYCTPGVGNFGYYEDLWYDNGHLVSFIDLANLTYDNWNVASNLAGRLTDTNTAHFARFLDSSESGANFASDKDRDAYMALKTAYSDAFSEYSFLNAWKTAVETNADQITVTEKMAAVAAAQAALDALNEGDEGYAEAKAALDTANSEYDTAFKALSKADQKMRSSWEFNKARFDEVEARKIETETAYKNAFKNVFGVEYDTICNVGNNQYANNDTGYHIRYINPANANLSNNSFVKVIGGKNVGKYYTIGYGYSYKYNDFQESNASATEMRWFGVKDGSLYTRLELTESGMYNSFITEIGMFCNQIFNYDQVNLKTTMLTKAESTTGGATDIWMDDGITSVTDPNGNYGGFTVEYVYDDNGFYVTPSFLTTRSKATWGRGNDFVDSAVGHYAFGNYLPTLSNTHQKEVIAKISIIYETGFNSNGTYTNGYDYTKYVTRIGEIKYSYNGEGNVNSIFNGYMNSSIENKSFSNGFYTSDASFRLNVGGNFVTDVDGGKIYKVGMSLNGVSPVVSAGKSQYAVLGTDGEHSASEVDSTLASAESVSTTETALRMGLLGMRDKNMYAFRFYDVSLTDAQKLQNHFADLLYYGGLEITDGIAKYVAGVQSAAKAVDSAYDAFVAAKAAGKNTDALLTAYTEKVSAYEAIVDRLKTLDAFNAGNDYGGALEKAIDYAIYYRELYQNRENLYAEYDFTMINDNTTGNSHYTNDSGDIVTLPISTFTEGAAGYEKKSQVAYTQRVDGIYTYIRSIDGTTVNKYMPMIKADTDALGWDNYYPNILATSRTTELNPTYGNLVDFIIFSNATAFYNIAVTRTVAGVDTSTSVYLSNVNPYYLHVYQFSNDKTVTYGPTEEQRNINMLVDMMRYYQVDVDKYVQLSDEGRAALTEKFAATEYTQKSPEPNKRNFKYYDLGFESRKDLIRASIEHEIETIYIAEKLGKTAEAMDALMGALGYSARTTLNVGLRSGYIVNTKAIADMGLTVKGYGAIVASASTAETFEKMTVSYDKVAGTITADNDNMKVVSSLDEGFMTFDEREKLANMNAGQQADKDNYLMFAFTIDFMNFVNGGYVDKDGVYKNADGSDMNAEEIAAVIEHSDKYDNKYMSRGFLILEDAEGNDYVWYVDCVTTQWTTGQVSIRELSDYFLENGFAGNKILELAKTK